MNRLEQRGGPIVGRRLNAPLSARISLPTSLLIVAFWLSVGLLYALSLYFDAIRFGTRFELSLTNLIMFESAYGSWALLTLALLKALRRPIIERRLGQTIALFVGGYVLWQPLFTLVDGTVAWALTGASLRDHLLGVRATYLFFHSILYIVVFVSCAVLIYYAHSRAMEAAAADLERRRTRAELGAVTWQLRSLQSQLSPHFLFNALNSLSGMARSSQNRDLVSALARLGDMLRFALETSNRSLITIAEEIEFTHHYVALQRLRFGERYRFDLTHRKDLETQSCPPFVLQSLVENAFTHAVDGSEALVTIRASIELGPEGLVFSVSNTPSPAPGGPGGLGIALKNLKERLELLYENGCSVTSDADSESYTARVRIPS